MSVYFLFSGVHAVAYAFPNVRLVTTAVDPEINDQFHILPGIGECVSVGEWGRSWWDFWWLHVLFWNYQQSYVSADASVAPLSSVIFIMIDKVYLWFFLFCCNRKLWWSLFRDRTRERISLRWWNSLRRLRLGYQFDGKKMTMETTSENFYLSSANSRTALRDFYRCDTMPDGVHLLIVFDSIAYSYLFCVHWYYEVIETAEDCVLFLFLCVQTRFKSR